MDAYFAGLYENVNNFSKERIFASDSLLVVKQSTMVFGAPLMQQQAKFCGKPPTP
jgi:hypothetical protein